MHTAAVAVPTAVAVPMVAVVPMVAAAPTEVDTVRGEPTVVRLGTALRKQQWHFFNFQITPNPHFIRLWRKGRLWWYMRARAWICAWSGWLYFLFRLRRRLFVIPIVVLNRLRRRRRSVWR